MTPKGEVPENKKKIVQELSDLIKNKRTVLVASIKNIPASQFQKIAKNLRGKAIVKVPKKNLMFRAFDASENEEIKKLKDQIKNSVAILFSDLESFDLAADLLNNTSPAKAKAGQEAPEDIWVDAGPTDLMPGPAISELGNLGIQIQIEKGKIHIKAPKVITKQGEKISAGAADIMNKLDIKPFRVGFIPLSSFDTKEGKLYLEIKVDKEKTLEELKTSYLQSLTLAIEIGYTSKDTIKFLIVKAGAHEKALEGLIKEENPKEEESKEEKVKQDKSTETKQSNDENSDLTDNKNSEPKSETNNQTQQTQEENK